MEQVCSKDFQLTESIQLSHTKQVSKEIIDEAMEILS